MPLTDRYGNGDDGETTDLGEIVVSAFRQFFSEVPAYMQGPEPQPWTDPAPIPPEVQARYDLLLALQSALLNEHTLTKEMRDAMIANNIRLGELLVPGIYQFEFDVEGTPGEHRQWVYVKPDGTSEMISGNRTGSSLTVFMDQSYEGNTSHGLAGPGDHRVYAVNGGIGSAASMNATWAAMEAAASNIQNTGFNYNIIGQNSNSVWNTVRIAGGLAAYDTGWAPAVDVDLTTRNLNFQSPPLSYDDYTLFTGSGTVDSYVAPATNPNRVIGGDGDDSLWGGNVFDHLQGDDGNDSITSVGGTVEGGNGDDTLSAASAGAGTAIAGDAGNDYLIGSAYADFLDGGEGGDTILAGNGDDRVWGAGGADVIHGEDGYDTLFGGDGDDAIYGGLGNDIVIGNGGSDHLEGGAGDDALYGFNGADTQTTSSRATI